MKIIYFDLCAIPLFLMILYICYARKMTRGSANQLFIFLVSLSLISTLADLGMETLDNMVPLSEAGRLTVSILAYVYLSMRNASTVVMLLFLLALTRTIFLIKRSWIRFVFFAPPLSSVQNTFTNIDLMQTHKLVTKISIESNPAEFI